MFEAIDTIETIAAIATPVGRGGVGVIRVSGPKSADIAKALIGTVPVPRQAALRKFYNAKQEAIDSGLALYFPNPHSFTGEDVLELQGHGGPVVMQMVLSAVLEQGARLAMPGEFTHRAFLNGKVDLAQAEAVADLIDASTQEAALGATRSLQGVFSERINTLAQTIMQLRILVEAGIDFPDEEVDFLSDTRLLEKLDSLIAELNTLLQQAKQGQLLKDGMTIAIVGQPNAGKSSLLNYLTQENTAIVTPIPGTTRDLVRATIQIDGIPIQLVDTAGMREQADEIEQQGIARSKEQQRLVDKIILLVDATAPAFTAVENEVLQTYGKKVILVFNKADLLTTLPTSSAQRFYISAKTGEGMPALLEHLKACMGAVGAESSVFISRQRHCDALHRTWQHAMQAKHQLIHNQAFELAAEELRYAQDRLGEIVGKVSSDELLGEIFSHFCIGK